MCSILEILDNQLMHVEFCGRSLTLSITLCPLILYYIYFFKTVNEADEVAFIQVQ